MTAPDKAVVAGGIGYLDRKDLTWWGMVLFICTEAALFAYLIASYFYVGGLNATWPPLMPGIHITAPNTVILILSSGSAILADRSIRKGNQGGLRLWLAITIALGLVFLGLQLYEYTTLDFHQQTDAYSSFFYLITGLHGAHVALGALMLIYVLVRAFAGHFDSVKRSAVSNAILYWHFVDIVWLVVFSTIYLVPRV